MGRVNVRDGFWVLLAALWCVDEDNLLPLFLMAALVHEAGHAAALYLAGGRLRQLTLTACGAVMQAALPCGRFACAAVSLAGPAAGFCADDRGEGLRRMASCRCKRAAQPVQSAPPPSARRRHGARVSLGRRISARSGCPCRAQRCDAAALRTALSAERWRMLGTAHRYGNMYFSTSYEKMQRNMCILTGFCAAFCIVFPKNGGFAWHSLAYGRIML